MNIHQLKRTAEEMQTPFNEAAFCRFRFVRQQMLTEAAVLDQLEGKPIDLETQEGIANYIQFVDAMDRFIDLAREQRILLLAFSQKRSAGRITDEQIDQARAYPIERLIEFTKGKALAPCHEDSNPSLSWDRQRNKAHCFVCDRSFNPIDYLMMIDCLSFVEAVKRLAT